MAVALIIWAGIVIVSMLAVSWLSLRWGRDPFGWAFLSAVLGPIALIALAGTRQSDLRIPAPFERFNQGRAQRVGVGAVLLAIDGSEASSRAATYVSSLHPAQPITIVTVLPREARPAAGDRPAEQAHEREVARLTSAARRVLREVGVEARVVVGFGSPGEEIVRLAEEDQAAVIVVGRKGAGLTKALLGSVSDYVVTHARRNVMVIE